MGERLGRIQPGEDERGGNRHQLARERAAQKGRHPLQHDRVDLPAPRTAPKVALPQAEPAPYLPVMHAISLTEKFGLFEEQWTPKIIAQLNGQDVKLAKIQGEFLWHAHAEQDELFHVIRGQMTMEFRDRKVRWDREKSSSCPRASSTGPSPKKRSGSCCSSRRTSTTQAGWTLTAPLNIPSTSRRSGKAIFAAEP